MSEEGGPADNYWTSGFDDEKDNEQQSESKLKNFKPGSAGLNTVRHPNNFRRSADSR